MSETVAFVGIGAMGMPMTAMLADNGYPVRAYDEIPSCWPGRANCPA